MKRSGDSTHHCRSPTPTLNGCDLSPSTEKQSSEQECTWRPARGTRQHRTPTTPPKLFTRNPAIYFPEVDKACVEVFGMLPGFLENMLESGNLICTAMATTKPHWVSSKFGSIIFAASWHTLFLGGLAKRCRGSWFIHSFLCMWTINSLIFWHIGVGAGKFLGVRIIFPEFSQTCPKNNPKRERDLQKEALHVILGATFSNQSMLGAIFAHICRVFARILGGFPRFFPDFKGICPDFHQVKAFGMRLHTSSYTNVSAPFQNEKVTKRTRGVG